MSTDKKLEEFNKAFAELCAVGSLVKSHIDSYTRQDGVTVQAHDDNRMAAAPAAPAMAKPKKNLPLVESKKTLKFGPGESHGNLRTREDKHDSAVEAGDAHDSHAFRLEQLGFKKLGAHPKKDISYYGHKDENGQKSFAEAGSKYSGDGKYASYSKSIKSDDIHPSVRAKLFGNTL